MTKITTFAATISNGCKVEPVRQTVVIRVEREYDLTIVDVARDAAAMDNEDLLVSVWDRTFDDALDAVRRELSSHGSILRKRAPYLIRRIRKVAA